MKDKTSDQVNSSVVTINQDIEYMQKAIDAAETVRCITSPNPWVGCVIVTNDGDFFTGATYESGDDHAEVQALKKAGEKASGATAYVTLEPCSHFGKTPPCVDALIVAGISRVVIGVQDPDERVSGTGIKKLRDEGIEVEVGIAQEDVSNQLAAYLKQRKTGLPYVVLKMAMTLDGNIADSDGESKWITGDEARIDSHKLRAESDAILVGANTVRNDNPSLNVRDWSPPILRESRAIDPIRIVLGKAEKDAGIHPCQEMQGSIDEVLKVLGEQEVLQLLVEGGASVARQFHEAGVVDKYVFYVAPAILGGVGTNVFGNQAGSLFPEMWRGQIESFQQLGSDIRIDIVKEED